MAHISSSPAAPSYHKYQQTLSQHMRLESKRHPVGTFLSLCAILLVIVITTYLIGQMLMSFHDQAQQSINSSSYSSSMSIDKAINILQKQ